MRQDFFFFFLGKRKHSSVFLVGCEGGEVI